MSYTDVPRVHNYWVHPFWRQNCNDRGAYVVFKGLEDDDRFQSFYRMEKKTFDLLIQLVGPKIKKKDTKAKCHIPISLAILAPGGKTSNANAQSTD